MDNALAQPAVPANGLVNQTVSRIRRLVWWGAFTAILLGGFVLAATGYKHGLPFIDFGDEMTIWTLGRSYIEPTYRSVAPNYPPGLPLVSAAVQKVQIALGDLYYNPSGAVEIMRVMALITHALALAVIMLLAYDYAGPFAGIAAGLFWAVLPLANTHAKLSTANAWLSLWTIASIAAGVEGWRHKSVRWITASLILGIVATLFKWQSAAAFLVTCLACLTFWRVDRRKALTTLAVCVVIIGLLSVWAVFIHRALDGDVYYPGVKSSMPTPRTIWINLEYQVARVGPVAIFGVLPLVALVLSAAIPAWRKKLHGQMLLWTLPLIVLIYEVIASVNGAPVFERHYLAAMTLLCVLAGVGVALLARAFGRLAERFHQRWLGWGLTAVLLGALLIPVNDMFNTSLAIANEGLRPDRQAIFAEWARTTATEGPLLITDPTTATAVQTLFGYRGRPLQTPYNDGLTVLVKGDQITQDKIGAQGIRYIITNPDYQGAGLTTPVTRLITFSNDARYRGPEWAAFYVGALPPQFPPDKVVTFGGEVVLRGYGLSKDRVCPGEAFKLQLLWGAANRPTRYYSAYLHLFSEPTGEISAPDNGHQPVSEDRPTISWIWPNELLVGPNQTLTLPNDVRPGTYQVWLGVFDPQSNTRLPLPDGTDHHILTTLTVTDCAR
ncbi:MAG: hypothetical protein IT324_29430 [Anaerolineae bacterium]|nr:hypothetical protein [Anaerolineae bacterium]